MAATKLVQRGGQKTYQNFQQSNFELPYLMPNLIEGGNREVVFEFYPQPYTIKDGNDRDAVLLHDYNTTNGDNLQITKHSTEHYGKNVHYSALKDWNNTSIN